MVKFYRPWILCVQETKLEIINDFFCASLWGNPYHSYSYRPSVGASGGILTIWDTTEVDVMITRSMAHVVIIQGKMLQNGADFSLANVYAPCESLRRQDVWNQLGLVISNFRDSSWCVCGDFNAIRSQVERKSRMVGTFVEDYSDFNQFIDNNILLDLPLCGRNYTWFRGDGISMSRLNRFLLSEDWCALWPNLLQRALNRGLSDHCPILLSVDEFNWGPRPRRVLKCWGELPGYKQFVRDSLQSFHIEEWGGYVLKEKLKMIKGNLHTWHQNHTQNLEGRLSNVQDRIAFLDAKGEDADLLHEEIEELHSLSANYHSLSRINTSMQWQKSRLLWLKEGDANSKFFHSIMASRRRANSIFFFIC